MSKLKVEFPSFAFWYLVFIEIFNHFLVTISSFSDNLRKSCGINMSQNDIRTVNKVKNKNKNLFLVLASWYWYCVFVSFFLVNAQFLGSGVYLKCWQLCHLHKTIVLALSWQHGLMNCARRVLQNTCFLILPAPALALIPQFRPSVSDYCTLLIQ